jgi:1-acyl-sn-glycerol-3-phosphate acyltransferase
VPREQASFAYAFTRRLARRMLASQYARLEVDGAERVPAEGPVILVANHGNSLVDSLALLVASPRPAAPLAKAPLFQNPILRPWLNGVGAVPVFREQDADENQGRGVRANMATFDACRERLQAGGAIVLFPEGVSQSQPRLLPLRTGVARIALDAARPLSIVPVGLVYEAPDRARGRLLALVGEPIPADGSRLERAQRRGEIAGLTRRIEAALHELLAEADSQHDLALLRLLAEARRQEAGLPPFPTFLEAHRATQVLSRGLVRLETVDPSAVAALRAQADQLARSLELTGLPLASLATRWSAGRVVRFMLLEALPALLLLPLALLAAAVTWPGRALGDVWLLRRTGGDEDVRVIARSAGWLLGTTAHALLGGLVLGLVTRPLVGLAFLLATWTLLGVHVALRDLFVGLATRVRAFALLAGSSLVRQDLLAQRRALVARLDAAAQRLAVV